MKRLDQATQRPDSGFTPSRKRQFRLSAVAYPVSTSHVGGSERALHESCSKLWRESTCQDAFALSRLTSTMHVSRKKGYKYQEALSHEMMEVEEVEEVEEAKLNVKILVPGLMTDKLDQVEALPSPEESR
ncbi:hypothetical protein H105_08456 [Trichophyton soudanense CBS 452.61]|uniref:Uncharacterized protein n=1 Tax=Trichophyton soudanense CBS 452.61 TaxID=1215331 RepID=A0A022XF89_TRISD|nr:hypothetical protein H105_08456 [Trichophyton soudanense CBS 452.61]EZG01422.1 hypothetical protein H106_08326 [Trichophyton rubrum CBS 735.88]